MKKENGKKKRFQHTTFPSNLITVENVSRVKTQVKSPWGLEAPLKKGGN